MVKRIFAVISDNEFYVFQQKAKVRDGLDMGEAFAALAHLYVTEDDFTLKEFRGFLARLKALHEDPMRGPTLSEVEHE
jgi:hypothetical protein